MLPLLNFFCKVVLRLFLLACLRHLIGLIERSIARQTKADRWGLAGRENESRFETRPRREEEERRGQDAWGQKPGNCQPASKEKQ